jgi:signal peptidase I
MNKKKKEVKIFSEVKKAWNWVWHSDSILSWIVALLIIFISVKYIFFPTLSLIMGTSLPLAGVESSSMDHQIVEDERGFLNLCGNIYLKEQKHKIKFDEYWDTCGTWYEEKSITKETFQDFSLKNGFRKGDIIIVWGRFKPKLGDIVIFKPGNQSTSPKPIIHSIVGFKKDYIMTKGDHNEDFLVEGNNRHNTDETKITQDRIIGKAIFKIPYLGWFKIWVSEFINWIIS